VTYSQVVGAESNGEPVHGADIVLAGLKRSMSNKQGYDRFYLPAEDYYPFFVRYDGHEELLYMEEMSPGKTHVYRTNPSVISSRVNVLSLLL
jgi:hypothetical protein